MSKKNTGLDLLEAMRMGVDYTRTIRLRGASLIVRPLSIYEHQQITTEVTEALMNMPEAARHRVNEESEFAKRVLIKATTSDVDKNDPKLTQYILDRMTPKELMAFFREYNRFTDSVDPEIEDLPVEKLNELVDTLKKNPSQLAECSGSELQAVCRHLLAGPTVG